MQKNPLYNISLNPDFSDIKIEHISPAISSLLSEAKQKVADLEKKATSTWDALMQPLVEIEQTLSRPWSVVCHLNSVQNSSDLRKVYESLESEVISFFLALSQNKTFYKLLLEIRSSESWKAMSAVRKKVVENRIRDAKRSGIDLVDEEQKTFKDICQRLSGISTEFSNAVLDATKSFTLILDKKSQVAGLLPVHLDFYSDAYNKYQNSQGKANLAVATAEDGPWLLSLDYPSYGPFMEYADSESERQKLYQAYMTRASSGKWDNTPRITELLRLRKQKASLLGFKNFSDYSVDNKMAQSPKKVYSLIDDLSTYALKSGSKELSKLEEFSGQKTAGKKTSLQRWDVAYFSRMLKDDSFGYKEEQLREYFPLSSVLTGLFDLANRVFSIEIKDQTQKVQRWHKDVSYFEIFDQGSTKARAGFYLDPYSRPENKRSGAWMDECSLRRATSKDAIQMPIAYLVCNFTPPVGERPSLLTFRDVETIFHEFGHGLQHMLTEVVEADLSGINGIKWDAVELPSQFMENWCYHKKTLLSFAKHYKTQEQLPESLYEKICAARGFHAGLALLRQLNFSLVDMRLHDGFDFEKHQGDALFSEQRRLSKHLDLFNPWQEERFLCSFLHIFAGGYCAGYYSYIWAEVLSSDAFSAFEQDAILESESLIKKVGGRFRKTVLALGGSLEPSEVFEKFRGRAPSIDALIRHRGLL
jgi:oligopeptidase A